MTIKLLFIISMACFFLEFARVTFLGIGASASGFELATTISLHESLEFDEEDTPDPYLIASFFCSLFGFSVVWEAEEHDKKMIISTCLAAAGVVSLFLFRITFSSLIETEGFGSLVNLEFGWGWTLSTLACAGAACAAFVASNLYGEKSQAQPHHQGSGASPSDNKIIHQNADSSGNRHSETSSSTLLTADCGAHKVVIRDCPTAGLGGEWILTEFPCFIGRDISAVQVLISDDSTSAVHAKLYIEAGAVMISDEHSLNGTFVNGKKITAPTELLTGDAVTIGETTLYFEVSE